MGPGANLLPQVLPAFRKVWGLGFLGHAALNPTQGV